MKFNKIINDKYFIKINSPIGEQFRVRIRQFPALVNCCTIDWFHSWSEQALQSVAKHFITEINDEHIINNIFNSIIETCQFMHTSTIETSQNFLQVLFKLQFLTSIIYFITSIVLILLFIFLCSVT